MITIQDSIYVGSFPRFDICPKDTKPEYAFIGRSNVGKSSLINMLCERKDLAHTSKKPGKTQMINYYLMDKIWYLVDLPGYGYAKTSKKTRLKWRNMIQNYLLKREQMQCAFILVDANVPPQQIDIDFMNWLGSVRIPFVICYTKIDRLKPEEVDPNLEKIRSGFLEHWAHLPQEFVTSSNEREGREDILKFIDSVNQQF